MSKLSYKKRKSMPKKSFALPGNKTAKNLAGKGGYPIPDIAHARNALARVAQFGTPAEQAAVKAKVYAKFPQLRKGAKKRAAKAKKK